MAKYESKKHPGTFLTTDEVVDPKTKTVFVTTDDGQEKVISNATLKRWWTKVEDETEDEEELDDGLEIEDMAAAAAAEEASEAEDDEDNDDEDNDDEDNTEDEDTEDESAEEEAPAKKEKKTPKVRAPKKANAALAPETAAALDNMYAKLNGMYFDDLLPTARITVRNTKRIYDCCSIRKDGENYEILMCAGTLEKSVPEIAATMLHAMVHIYCAESEIVETCQNGRYHNAKFKTECEDRDLAVEYDRANGHVHTSATEIFTENLREAGIDLDKLSDDSKTEERA